VRTPGITERGADLTFGNEAVPIRPAATGSAERERDERLAIITAKESRWQARPGILLGVLGGAILLVGVFSAMRGGGTSPKETASHASGPAATRAAFAPAPLTGGQAGLLAKARNQRQPDRRHPKARHRTANRHHHRAHEQPRNHEATVSAAAPNPGTGESSPPVIESMAPETEAPPAPEPTPPADSGGSPTPTPPARARAEEQFGFER
jgi:hypothetical protein